MRTTITAAALLLSAIATTSAFAQSSWDKMYSVSSRPALSVEVGDASVKTHGCGGCREVKIHVDWRGSDPSQWSITEMQGGNGIHFAMKHKETVRMFGGWHGHAPEVSVETPSESDLNIRAGDGSLAVASVRGSIDMHTGDGSIAADQVAGALHLTTGDGSVQLHDAEGTLFATTGDGSMDLQGRFTQIDARSGNGSIQVSLAGGSQLQSGAHITTGDGSISLRVPRDLRANLEATSGDGNIACNLPLMSNTTSNGNRHAVRGALNGGGPVLQLHSGDGSIAISGQ